MCTLLVPPYSAAWGICRLCRARRTFSAVAGIEMRTPIASVMAFITAGGAPDRAGLAAAIHAQRVGVQGVSVSATWKLGTLSALGMQ